jgi:hypothetical protein
MSTKFLSFVLRINGLHLFGGLVIIQKLFSKLELKTRLSACFNHLPSSPLFGHHMIALILIAVTAARKQHI